MPEVKYYGQLFKHTGCKKERVEADALKKIFHHIRQKHGQDAWVLAKRSAIFINGKNYLFCRQPLKHTDTVHIFPPVAGG